MTLLYRCDNDMCAREGEAHHTVGTRATLPLSNDWRWSPYGDFCCDDCEREVTDEEQRKERERHIAHGLQR